ncbi:DUF1510 family protein [Sporosarcina luteola]|uniref:YrrS family protein n=1 Tax=Sporosarcina luteola TaxID=582850 RepID=UPI002041E5E0|nr:DUF1510 family protein [Sporosarcina luteola]MCM3743425.1 DUF1510 family protein [Sporosarcina luteola]
MKGNEPRYSRVNRKKMRNRSNRLLNSMIGLVILLILIVGASIITGNKDDEGKENASEEKVLEESGSSDDEAKQEENDSISDVEDEEGSSEHSDAVEDDADESSSPGTESEGTEGSEDSTEEVEEPGTVVIVPGTDEIIKETITNPAWQPIGTDQSGEHVSKYEAGSIDYNEKKKAIAYATGFSEDQLFYKRVKNGGGPQKSIGIVTTKDGSKIFRVYIEWVDGKGWKPTRMDVLKTLDFEY